MNFYQTSEFQNRTENMKTNQNNRYHIRINQIKISFYHNRISFYRNKIGFLTSAKLRLQQPHLSCLKILKQLSQTNFIKERLQTIHFELGHLSSYATVTITDYLIYNSRKMLGFEEDAVYKLLLELDLITPYNTKKHLLTNEQVPLNILISCKNYKIYLFYIRNTFISWKISIKPFYPL